MFRAGSRQCIYEIAGLDAGKHRKLANIAKVIGHHVDNLVAEDAELVGGHG
jgi:hypothetical protein